MSSRDPARREIVFYSDFPFGYHNREAEEKMARFAARGYRVVYVEQLGIRNPSLRHAGRLVRSVARRRGSPSPAGVAAPFDVVSPKLLPPRHTPGVDALNRRWLARQLLAPVRDPSRAIFWVRYPTPEVIGVLDDARPALVVYEQVDDHATSPGMTPRLRALYRRVEDELLSRAGLVFAWSEPLRAALAERHPNVVLATASFDASRFAPLAAQPPSGDRVAAYTGSIDFRFDAELVRSTAERLPEWRFVLAGPVLDPRAASLGDLPNVDLLGALEPAAVPGVVEAASVCLMPYRTTEFADMLFPIKLVEYLAAGRAVVSTPVLAVREFADVVRTATTAGELAAAIEESAASDSADERRHRAERAAPYSWDARIDDMERAIEEALGRG